MDRIRQIAEKLRQAASGHASAFRDEAHGWRMRPRLPEADVATFEAEWGVRLPDEYRSFITWIGDGGAGPAYGMFALRQGVENRPRDFLRSPFPHVKACGSVDDPDGRDAEEPDAGGTLSLCHEGCGYIHFLVVTGPARGQMWIDARGGDGGYVPLKASFLDWYERWIDHVLAGGDGVWWMET